MGVFRPPLDKVLSNLIQVDVPVLELLSQLLSVLRDLGGWGRRDGGVSGVTGVWP